MSTPIDWTAIGVMLGALLALLKVSRQTGRIEEGVKGLYDRVDRIEDWIDGKRPRRRR